MCQALDLVCFRSNGWKLMAYGGLQACARTWWCKRKLHWTNMGTWGSNPGPLAFPHASWPTELARLFVYGIINKYYIRKRKLTYQNARNLNGWITACHATFLIPSSVGKSPDFYLRTKSVAISLFHSNIAHTRDKSIVMVPIYSSQPYECHGTSIVA